MIFVPGLPLNVVAIILDCIFSILLNNFKVQGRRSIPITTTAGTVYTFMHTMSTLWSSADAVSCSNESILFKGLELNPAMYIVLLYLKYFCLYLSFVAVFRTLWPEILPQQNAPLFLTARRIVRSGNMVRMRDMVIFQWLYLLTSSIGATLND